MADIHQLVVYSGFVVLVDPVALSALGRGEPDRELLEHGAADGALHFWPAPEEQVTIWLAVDEPLPDGLVQAVREESSGRLHVPSGELWLTDPAFLFDVRHAGDECDGRPEENHPCILERA